MFKTKRIQALILTRIGKRKHEDYRKTALRIQEVCGISFSAAERFLEYSLDTIYKEKEAAQLTSHPNIV